MMGNSIRTPKQESLGEVCYVLVVVVVAVVVVGGGGWWLRMYE